MSYLRRVTGWHYVMPAFFTLLLVLLVWAIGYGIFVRGPQQRAEMNERCTLMGMQLRDLKEGQRCVDERGAIFLPLSKSGTKS